MRSDDRLSTNETELAWPRGLSALLVMGKRQGTKRENKQLWARVALSAALWYSAPDPKPYILFVAADVHGPWRTPDARVVKNLLVDTYKISADYVMLRPVSNCTLVEVRAVRALSKIYRLSHIFAITHLYHAARSQRYFDEVLPNASVIPVHPDILAEITLPDEHTRLFAELPPLIAASMPSRFDLFREHLIEFLMSYTHTLDPHGRFERSIARLLRRGRSR